MKHLRDLYTKALEDYEKELIKRQELEERINKAIEFVDRWRDNWYKNSMYDDKGYLCLLLDILKEGQNENF